MNESRSARAAGGRLLIAGVLLGIVSGCGASEDGTGGHAGTTVHYRGPFVTGGSDAPIYYARELGYYAEEGIDIEIRDSKGSGQTITDVSGGGSDVGMAAVTNLMLAVGQGQEVTAVATVLGRSSFGFFVPSDSGPSSIAGLKGRSVAVTALVESNMYAALAAAGLSKSDVRPVVADANALITTYLSGEVDSMYTARHFLPAVQRRSSEVLLQSDAGFNPPDYALLVRPDMLRDRPEVVRGFVRATLRGFQAAERDPRAAVDALLAEHPELEPEQALGTLRSVLGFMCSPTQAGRPYGAGVDEDWSTTAEALQRFAGLEGPTDGSRFFTNELFEEDGLAVATC